MPGTLSADYSQYNYLAFTAKGSGLIELGLLKSSIQDWKAQYKVMVDLSEEEQTYYVPFDIFSSSATQEKLTAEDLTKLKALYNNFIFDIFGLQKESSTAKNDYLDDIMNVIMNIRNEAKASKNWALSDLIRDELKNLNITIQDSKDGSNWTVEN